MVIIINGTHRQSLLTEHSTLTSRLRALVHIRGVCLSSAASCAVVCGSRRVGRRRCMPRWSCYATASHRPTSAQPMTRTASRYTATSDCVDNHANWFKAWLSLQSRVVSIVVSVLSRYIEAEHVSRGPVHAGAAVGGVALTCAPVGGPQRVGEQSGTAREGRPTGSPRPSGTGHHAQKKKLRVGTRYTDFVHIVGTHTGSCSHLCTGPLDAQSKAFPYARPWL